eukprot:3361720-Rhodomonas_salina.3
MPRAISLCACYAMPGTNSAFHTTSHPMCAEKPLRTLYGSAPLPAYARGTETLVPPERPTHSLCAVQYWHTRCPVPATIGIGS